MSKRKKKKSGAGCANPDANGTNLYSSGGSAVHGGANPPSSGGGVTEKRPNISSDGENMPESGAYVSKSGGGVSVDPSDGCEGEKLPRLSVSYAANVAEVDRLLRVEECFDILKKVLRVGTSGDEITLYYIDGFTEGGLMQKLLLSFTSQKGLGGKAEEASSDVGGRYDPSGSSSGGEVIGETVAREFLITAVPHIEAAVTDDLKGMLSAVLSGQSLVLGSRFGASAIVIDSRTYPARTTAEPENDKVMRGARDGFVETLIFNTALIRRRVRDRRLTMTYLTVGEMSKTDIVISYIDGVADAEYVENLKRKISSIKTDALTMGHQSLAECLLKTRWYNPFPKIRTTERPDTAAAQLIEGSVLVVIDNSPEVMILPSTLFDFVQETNDFYYPPLTATYIRIVRHIILLLTLLAVPVWYYFVGRGELLPDFLHFLLPESRGKLPIFVQIMLIEFIIDGLKMASMNTPDMLSNSLSVVGGLILGDFAVSIGWLIPEVILFMAFIAIANFTQRSYELGYALKFMRMSILILTALLGGVGLLLGIALVLVLICTNKTVNGACSYLYPLIPFDGRAFLSYFIRVRKRR